MRGNKQEVCRAPYCSDICRDGDPPPTSSNPPTPPCSRSGICLSVSGAQLWQGRGRIRPLLCPSHLPHSLSPILLPPHCEILRRLDSNQNNAVYFANWGGGWLGVGGASKQVLTKLANAGCEVVACGVQYTCWPDGGAEHLDS